MPTRAIPKRCGQRIMDCVAIERLTGDVSGRYPGWVLPDAGLSQWGSAQIEGLSVTFRVLVAFARDDAHRGCDPVKPPFEGTLSQCLPCGVPVGNTYPSQTVPSIVHRPAICRQFTGTEPPDQAVSCNNTFLAL